MEKRKEILLTAMKLFVERDVQATPMTAIANAAHTGMGAIYNYFCSKEVLINSIFIHIKEQQYDNLKVGTLIGTVKEQFDNYYSRFSFYLIQHPYEYHFLCQFEHSPIITSEVRAWEMKLYEPIAILFSEGQRQGIIKNINTQELLEFLNGATLRFIRFLLETGKNKQQHLLENHLTMAWDAVKV